MRGKDSWTEVYDTSDRITPAYAGKSATGATSSIVKKDHPRLCGEKILFFVKGCFLWGSPPPMRGKERSS